MKVLILGNTQSLFINQLYGGIKHDDRFNFIIDSRGELSKSKMKIDSKIFDGIVDLKNVKINKLRIYKTLFNFSITSLFWKVFFFELSQGTNYTKLKSYIYKLVTAKYIVNNVILPLEIDIYHFHFCTPENLILSNFLPAKSKIIMSFWGSDLLRQSGVSNTYYVRNALLKATKITVQTIELKEYIAVKYGRDIFDKIVDIRFTLSTNIFENIDLLKNDLKSLGEFKEKYGINKNDTLIALGHNAYKENNHLLMIDSIKKLPNEFLKQVTFLFHLGYGKNNQYINELKNILETETNIKHVLIEEFLQPKEMAKLRLITDVLIQMPISDALSGAMTEVIYAGNNVIAGAWLPYGIFKRNNIHFYEVENFNRLNNLLKNVVENKNNSIKNNYAKNKEIIRSFLFPNITTKSWIKLFNNLMNINN